MIAYQKSATDIRQNLEKMISDDDWLNTDVCLNTTFDKLNGVVDIHNKTIVMSTIPDKTSFSNYLFDALYA